MRPPSKDEHLRKAEKNKAFARSILSTDSTSIGWVLVALFYSALHFVDAFGAKYNTPYSSHKQRNEDVQRNPQLERLRDDYLDLYTLGWNARYTMQIYGEKEHREAMDSLAIVESEIRALL
jgi:hypothetical protein